jgi:signal transduction histidine kinase
VVQQDAYGFDAVQALDLAAGRVNWGLVGMQERIEALGGTFAIESPAGRGTTVLPRVPLH